MGTEDSSAFNHVGHCVTDLACSRRFYEEVLGFQFLHEIHPPEDPTSQLLQVKTPVAVTAACLRLDGLILELLYYDRSGNPPAVKRVMNEPGLTHLSVSVEDIPSALERAQECGGAVIAEANLGTVAMIRDPDGQLIELLPMSYRRGMAEQGF